MSQLKKYVIGWVGVWMCTAALVQAAPFAKTIQFQQPDGTAISLWGEGDEFRAVFETPDGYTVTFDPASKTYFYASVSADGSQLVATDLEVGKGNPQALGLAKHVRISDEAARQQTLARVAAWDQNMQMTQRWNAQKAARRQAEDLLSDGPVLMAPPSFTTTGVKRGLTLLIDFENDQETIHRDEIDDFCNGDAYTHYGNNGSVKKYYLDNSNGLLVYSNTVTAYIRIPNSVHPKSYYNDTSKDCGTQARLLINDAVAIMKALPNYTTEILPTFNDVTVDAFGNIVACNVYYAGGNGDVWSFGLWPHSSSLGPLELSPGGKKINHYQVTNIGNSLTLYTFCHENGHMLCGFPDIYDYDGSSRGGAGDFCLMDGRYNETNPQQICAYLKRAAGWSTTIELTYSSNVNGVLVAAQGEAGFNTFYRYAKPGTATEYFLFENRQKSGRDASIPAAGIAIWHIDELGNKDNESLAYNATHKNYECTLMQADNLWHFQGNVNGGDANDMYFNGNSAAAYTGVFMDSSAPSARWWDGTSSKLEVGDISVNGSTMTFRVVPRPPVMLTLGALPPGRVGTYYSYPLGAVGGVPPYTWELIAGSLPAGINLDAGGLISGLPIEAASAVFTVAVWGDNGVAATNELSLLVNPAFEAPFTETFENGGTMPDAWSQEFVTNSVSWTYLNGSSKGHPAAAHGGSYNACLVVATTNPTVTRLVSPMVNFGEVPHAVQLSFWHYMEKFADDQDHLRVYYKIAYDEPWILLQTYKASVNQWQQHTLTLPEVTSSTYYFAFEGTARAGYGIYVDDVNVCDPTPPLGIATPSPLPNAIINVAYTQTLAAVGGELPYTFTLASGNLPPGMGLSEDGVISGTTPDVGTYTFEVEVSDQWGYWSISEFTLSVTLPKVDLFNETFEHDGQLPAGWTQEYVTNGVNWRCQDGGGDIYNFHQPASAHGGSYNAILWATTHDVDHKTRLITPVINLGAAPVSSRLVFWLCMTADRTYQDELRVFYRTSASDTWHLLAEYTQSVPDWTLQSLPLPNPSSTYYLAFEGNARFANGVCIDDVRITDESSAPIITTASPLPNGFVNVPYVETLAAAGGSQPYTWGAVSNTLPSGLVLSESGVISGTPVSTGVSSFKVWVTGADGYASTNLFSLQVKKLQGFPFLETFDTATPPTGWTQEKVGTSRANWQFRPGSPRGTPLAAHSPLTNACLYYDEPSTYHITKLVSPMLNLGNQTPNTRLSFWMCMASDTGGYLDQLRVYYKTNSTASWTLINGGIFTKEVTSWTNIVLNLTNSTPTYYIAFEGWAKFGKGVNIDDVAVTGDFSPYGAWQAEHFTPAEISEGLITGDNDDPDGDGIPNALEYAYGFDPRVPDATGLPFGGVTAGYLTLSFRMDKEAFNDGVIYQVEGCTDLILSDWTTVDVSEQLPRADSNTWWQAVFQHDVPVTNAPRRFLRLKVYLP